MSRRRRHHTAKHIFGAGSDTVVVLPVTALPARGTTSIPLRTNQAISKESHGAPGASPQVTRAPALSLQRQRAVPAGKRAF